MHRPGIEPGPPAWQASILPLNHRCYKFIGLVFSIVNFININPILIGLS